MLSAKGIKKKYGQLEVIKGVDIDIKNGEVVSIIGASGAGKSTLLQILGTLDSPDSGTIMINNMLISDFKFSNLASFRNKEIGFIFQFHHLLPEFSALENVSIPAWIGGKNRNETEKKATDLLSLLGLKNRVHHKPNELSGGEQQRVAVARALINNPSIIMADEPTGNLDSFHAKELHELFIKLRGEFQQTFLIVTHNEELAKMSDRVLVMKDGYLQR